MWRRRRAALALLLPVAALCVPLAQAAEVAVANSEQFFTALMSNDSSIDIQLTGDIELSKGHKLRTAQVTSGRRVSISSLPGRGPVLVRQPKVDVLLENATVLDFGEVWPILNISNGGLLVLKSLVIRGAPSPFAPDVAAAAPVRMQFSDLWPSVLYGPGARLSINNTLIHGLKSDCSFAKQNLIVAQLGLSPEFAGQAGLLPDKNLRYILGTHNYTFQLTNYTTMQPLANQYFTTVTTDVYGFCQVDPWQTGTNAPAGDRQSSDTGTAKQGGGVPFWVWLIVALVAALVIAGVVIACLALRRRRRVARERAAALIFQDRRKNASAGGNTAWEVAAIRIDTQISDEPETKICVGAPMDNVELGALIGRGAYGRVYRGMWRGALVAVKVIEHPSTSGADFAATARESALSSTLCHPCIVTTFKSSTVQTTLHKDMDSAFSSVDHSVQQLRLDSPELAGQPGAAAAQAMGHPSSTDPGSQGPQPAATPERAASNREGSLSEELGFSTWASTPPQASQRSPLYETWLLLEYCDKGSLAEAIRKERFVDKASGQPSLRGILSVLQQIAGGMAYLHEKRVVHGDLKAANVLLKTAEGGARGICVKIADFGLSRIMSEEAARHTQSIGTISYMAPELMAYGRLSKECDVWSYGVIMWELMMSDLAYKGQLPAQIYYELVTQGHRLPDPPNCPPAYARLMRACWELDPKFRPKFDAILAAVERMQKQLSGSE